MIIDPSVGTPLIMAFSAYILAASSPGPSNLAIMNTAMSRGRVAALALAAGVVSVSWMWAVLASTGVATVLKAWPSALNVMQFIGGCYLFDDRADEPPTNAEALLRMEQGFREVLQRGQNDQAASSFFSDPGMPAGRDDPNRSVSDAFAAAGSRHAGVEAAAPPVLAASQQQIRPSPDALDRPVSSSAAAGVRLYAPSMISRKTSSENCDQLPALCCRLAVEVETPANQWKVSGPWGQSATVSKPSL
ncbi:LysE family translocator [Mesorhizobium sp. L48C026A00]|uniref:LysE family translocator n=1 Tax=Mesorhizobium sp. L48C026A00 TaxID=1287182 RepID=UPI0003D02B27|nr:LysE family transporter [Mesorhizobium sp. L48C026A00]ESZ03480.1 hypothetical protein X737_37685 [Mesorhizobium sp. L48C026A00]